MSTVPPPSSSSIPHHHHDPTCTSFFTLLLQSRFPSLKSKPRFSDFIEPRLIAADNNESKDIESNDHAALPGSSSNISKISFVIGAVASALTISPASVPHMRSWGLVLLVHFCGLLVSRCIAGLIFFGIQKPLLPFGVRYLFLSAKMAVRATGWVLLLLLFNIFVVRWVFDGTSAIRFFRSLRTLMYLFTAGQTTFYVFQSLFFRRKFFPWMKQTASHLYTLDALMGPPRCKKSRPKAEEEPVRLFNSMILAAFCTDSPLVDVIDTVLFCVDGLLMVAAESMQLTSAPFCMNSLLRVAGDRKLLADIDGSAKSKFKVNSQMKIQGEAQQAFWRINPSGHKFIKREDMLRFLAEDEVDSAFLLVKKTFGTTKIDKFVFQEWVVETYRRRKSLLHAIVDTKRMMSILNRFAMAFIMAIFLLSSLVKGMTSTTAFMTLVSQLYLLQSAYQNNIKKIFDSILFVFVAQPFDVGDCCVIDGAQMIVEEMNITSTGFLRFDQEKICYSNSELLAKTIINYNQNPDIGEKIEFLIDISTPEETVVELRKRVEAHLKGKPEHWQAKHSILMKGTTEERKMKMNLYVLHKMNCHNFPGMNKHKSELLNALKEIFESLGIKNYAFPGSSLSPMCHGDGEDTAISCSSSQPCVISPKAELLAKPISNDNREGKNIEILIDVRTPEETLNKQRKRVRKQVDKPKNWQRKPPLSIKGIEEIKIKFLVDVCTPNETLHKLRKRVREQLSKPENWQRKPSLSIKGIEESKIKIDLHVVPKTNYQSSHDMRKLRSDLLFALKKIIEGVGIKNYEIPREVSRAPSVHGCWEETLVNFCTNTHAFHLNWSQVFCVSGITCLMCGPILLVTVSHVV